MNASLSPVESEFSTAEEAEACDRWFCAKVRASLADSRPTVPHDKVMAEVEAIVQEAEQKQAARRPPDADD